MPAYRPVIEPIEAYRYGSDRIQPGDPLKTAAFMIPVVDSPHSLTPPHAHSLLTVANPGVKKQNRAAA